MLLDLVIDLKIFIGALKLKALSAEGGLKVYFSLPHLKRGALPRLVSIFSPVIHTRSSSDPEGSGEEKEKKIK